MTEEKSGAADSGDTEERVFSAQDARGGEIILRTRTRRVIFFAGLAGCVLLGLVLYVFT
ncbi:hypothetical protein FHT82_004422 [Rhizobium sp. BK275]|uniref:peptide ABC transporter permease n=1 Tax=unclassified Rhizobium TaxID=2613769 RepID=UPI001619C32F|nr:MULTISPECIES: peptide ABC transporter permease [unclassified Rhizobium]MBB3391644.1 hypothetical protein [Rhizobium sp. BK275]MBB3410054.1 hypothetical protein [Rhizobium sp. BK316]